MEISSRISPRVWDSALRLANTITAALVHGHILNFLLNKAIAATNAATNDERIPFNEFILQMDRLNVLMLAGLCVIVAISYASTWDDENVVGLFRLALGSFLLQSGAYVAFRFYLNSQYNYLFPVVRMDDETDFLAFLWGTCATCGGLFILLFPDRVFPCADDHD